MAESIKGLRDLLKKLDKLEGALADKVDAVIGANSREIERNAKSDAPLKNGKLEQSIKAIKLGELKWTVEANATGLAPYAAYMEFGTGGLVNVPSELQAVAAQFRGKGVKQVNIRPRPYLYPALVKQREQFVKDLWKMLSKETNI